MLNWVKYSRMYQVKFVEDSLKHMTSNFYRLSSTNFAWSILQCFAPNDTSMMSSSVLNFLMLWVQEKPETYPSHGNS